MHAVTSLPMMAQRDPWVNMLRTTLAAFSAGVGGADTVLVHPFDVAIPGGFPGTAASFARRIARNTQLLLLEESHIGRVLDPAGGSWFVEDLTEQLAEQAWKHFQDIESRGGFEAARDYVAAQIAEVRRPPRPTTSRTGAPRSPVSTSTRTSPNRRCRRAIRMAVGGTLRGRVRGAAGPLGRVPGEARVAAAGARCCRSARWPSTTSAPRSPSNLLASGGIEAVNPGPSRRPVSPRR